MTPRVIVSSFTNLLGLAVPQRRPSNDAARTSSTHSARLGKVARGRRFDRPGLTHHVRRVSGLLRAAFDHALLDRARQLKPADSTFARRSAEICDVLAASNFYRLRD